MAECRVLGKSILGNAVHCGCSKRSHSLVLKFGVEPTRVCRTGGLFKLAVERVEFSHNFQEVKSFSFQAP
ncbi:hypothetical protein KOW79_018630 [Hemibagrus wyckioides]|uniref:Uncharacterized protein n=1 Tax=Hemibagrus wyckioides TaxID=337641 RepID=A0A9D3NAN1_9TELE|nr:hypothetical protein KOW79_018630 [Hemibagrus wyckioides]